MTDSSSPTDPSLTAIRLGKKWMAIVHEDGSVILHYLAEVHLCGTDQTLNLMESMNNAQREVLEQFDDDRFAVRTVLLLPDGSVACDNDAISPKGIPTEDVFVIFPPALHSAQKYFKRRSGHNDW